MNVFWIGVSIALFFFAWRGYRLGLVRSLLGLLALSLGALLGWFFGGAAAGVIGSGLPWPPFYTQVAAAGGLAIGAYVVTAIFSGLLLKKTKDHESSWMRFIFGFGGAVVGLVTGAMIGAAGLWLVGQMHAGKNSEGVVAPSPAASVDGTYRVFEKVMKVTADPKAMERLMEYPTVQNIIAHPKIVELSSKPEINEAVLNKDYMALLSNPLVLKALSDPSFVEELRQVELEKALDYSLKTPSEKK